MNERSPPPSTNRTGAIATDDSACARSARDSAAASLPRGPAWAAPCCHALASVSDRSPSLLHEAYRCVDGELDGIERLTAEWVFAYGSLIWDPGFPFAERHLARVNGYHRRYCIKSTRYRGTDADPGIVLGLDHGGSCQGLVFRFEPDLQRDCIEVLYHREMASLSYKPVIVNIVLADGRNIEALAFVADHQSATYEPLGHDEVLRRLARCHGSRGPNRDYAINTWVALQEWGIDDTGLASIAQALDRERRPR